MADDERRAERHEPRCTCGSRAVIDAGRHDETCWRRLWVENVLDAPPQGEDHEVARLNAATEWLAHGPMLTDGYKDCRDAAIDLLAALPSPSRDGSVAVEDVERWCEEHRDGPGDPKCLACVGASHDAWMHRAKRAEAENEAWRRGECACRDDHASWCPVYRLDQALDWMEHESSMPEAEMLAQRLRPAEFSPASTGDQEDGA